MQITISSSIEKQIQIRCRKQSFDRWYYKCQWILDLTVFNYLLCSRRKRSLIITYLFDYSNEISQSNFLLYTFAIHYHLTERLSLTSTFSLIKDVCLKTYFLRMSVCNHREREKIFYLIIFLSPITKTYVASLRNSCYLCTLFRRSFFFSIELKRNYLNLWWLTIDTRRMRSVFFFCRVSKQINKDETS